MGPGVAERAESDGAALEQEGSEPHYLRGEEGGRLADDQWEGLGGVHLDPNSP